jgi:TolA-binding protein
VHPVANDRFAAAMATFQAGSYGQADSLLASFTRDFPGDARTEDASFLRAVAHARLGDRKGAAILARAYLAVFPSGLRRKEAEALVRGGAKDGLKPLEPNAPDGL